MDTAYLNRIIHLLSELKKCGCKETILDLRNNQVLSVSFIDFEGNDVGYKVAISDFEFDYLLQPKEQLEKSLTENLMKYENAIQLV